MKLPIHIAAKNKSMRSSRGLPDLFIAEPYYKLKSLGDNEYKHYYGLFIELKSEDTILYKKDGVTLRKKEHVEEQAEILRQLSEKGYKAVFAVGYEEAKKIIDEYLKK
jgi:DNA-binding sugar fermentation-stimulating protein